ncbi:MAG: DUF2334 domain-containing protein [Kiritimatiellia bacterium]|jgi:peptidoglycan/xylan/chitin deacetylase (PgdA/CDA1 family)
MKSCIKFLAPSLFLIACAAWTRAVATPLPNPGFEDGTNHWSIADGHSRVLPEAARTGKNGIRVGKLEYCPSGASVFSSKFAVAPGQRITLSFWARSTAANCGAYLWFYDKNGKLVGNAKGCGIKDSKGAWSDYSLETTTPDNAAEVGIWIHTYAGAGGEVDLDDFALGGLPADAAALPPPAPRARKQKAVNVKPEDIPARKQPPIIVLKLDDVKQVKGGDVHWRWKRIADYLEKRQIKGGFGVVCETLDDAAPKYTQWFADRRKLGFIEFWFHGYDHATHAVEGVKFNEFNKRSYEEQKERTAKSQALAREKLGFAFTAFGPPGGVGSGSFDENTLRVMAEDPDIQVMMYPQPFNDIGREYDSTGKLKILDRVWAVNLESAVGVPDFQAFLNGYAANPDRDYFVLQGHPAAWDDARFAEFERIIDFLVSQKAVFMTPSELAPPTSRQKSPAPKTRRP